MTAAESQVIFDLFAGTVNPAPNVREQAEIQLKQVKHFLHSPQLMLHLCRLVNKPGSVLFFCK